MKRFICTVCNYIHEGDAPPETCPVCAAPRERFSPLGGADGRYKGTKTEKNLWEAFSGESRARNKYYFFAEAAQRDGFEQIAAFFRETAENERQHAKMWYQELCGIGTTGENLITAAEGEHEEWAEMYARMAKEAVEEGFPYLAERFLRVGDVEKAHEERYLRLLENIRTESVFRTKGGDTVWMCRQCGYLHSGAEAPGRCPACGFSQSYFERKADNY